MNKSAEIRRLLNLKMKPKAVAKKLKTNVNLVYQVGWAMRKDKKQPSKIIKAVKEVKQALDKIESKPKKLFVQPQYEHAAMKILADNDLVNHPPHYTKGGIETIDFIEAKDLNYRLGNVIKYVSRVGKKGDPIQDLEKAAWYLQREITARKNA